MINTQPAPYQVGFAPPSTTSMEDLKRQFEIQKREEKETHKSTQLLPGTLNTLVSQIGDIYLKFVDIRNALEQSKSNTTKTQEIQDIQDKIDEINEQIFDLTNYFDKISL